MRTRLRTALRLVVLLLLMAATLATPLFVGVALQISSLLLFSLIVTPVVCVFLYTFAVLATRWFPLGDLPDHGK